MTIIIIPYVHMLEKHHTIKAENVFFLDCPNQCPVPNSIARGTYHLSLPVQINLAYFVNFLITLKYLYIVYLLYFLPYQIFSEVPPPPQHVHGLATTTTIFNQALSLWLSSGHG